MGRSSVGAKPVNRRQDCTARTTGLRGRGGNGCTDITRATGLIGATSDKEVLRTAKATSARVSQDCHRPAKATSAYTRATGWIDATGDKDTGLHM